MGDELALFLLAELILNFFLVPIWTSSKIRMDNVCKTKNILSKPFAQKFGSSNAGDWKYIPAKFKPEDHETRDLKEMVTRAKFVWSP